MFNGRRFKCARHGSCIYQLIAGVCLWQPTLIAVDRAGHYGNHSEPNENYPLAVDLHWCPARGTEIGTGETAPVRRGRPKKLSTEVGVL